LFAWEVVEDLHAPAIQVIQPGTFQEHVLPLPENRSAFAVKQRRPLFRDFALQFEKDIVGTLLNFCDLQHLRPLSALRNLLMPCSTAMAVPE
jgi:hypothetical protein